MAYNMARSGPEMACQDLGRHVDGCAHDMWGAGCLMYQAFTGSQPWHVGSRGPDSDEKQWANLYRQHQTWVCFALSHASTQKLCCPVHSSRACTGLLVLLAGFRKQHFDVTNHVLGDFTVEHQWNM